MSIPVKVEDFLDEDPPLRGQNYVCLSFLSPEEILKQKDVFMFEAFLSKVSHDLRDMFAGLSNKYPDEKDGIRMIQERYSYLFDTRNLQDELNFFIANHSNLEKEFFEKNNFQTCIRGIKVRGVFDTLREAEIRAQVLKKRDDKFNVYVAQVGCWCPWSPNPDDIANQEFAETQLNTLMKNYKENQDLKDMFYEERKKDLKEMATKSVEINASNDNTNVEVSEVKENIASTLQEKDPWIQRVEENKEKV